MNTYVASAVLTLFFLGTLSIGLFLKEPEGKDIYLLENHYEAMIVFSTCTTLYTAKSIDTQDEGFNKKAEEAYHSCILMAAESGYEIPQDVCTAMELEQASKILELSITDPKTFDDGVKFCDDLSPLMSKISQSGTQHK